MISNQKQSVKQLTASTFSNQQTKQQQQSYSFLCLHDDFRNNNPSSPDPTANAQMVYYKNKLYFYGGLKLSQQKLSPTTFYSFDLQTKMWYIHHPKAFGEKLKTFVPKCNGLVGNKWFLLGNENKKQKEEQAKMWKLNFQLLDWMKIDQRAEYPKYLENGCLVGLQKNYLVYFGGYSQKQNKCSNTTFLFNVDSKTWHPCQGSYTKSIKARFSAALVNINNKIFLYGGYYKRLECLQVLQDFYQITFRLPGKGIPAQAYFRRISSFVSPSPRAEHQLFACESNNICLFGGKNDQSNFSNQLWSFHLVTGQWKLIDQIDDKLMMRQGSSSIQGCNNIYIFGGMESSQDQKYRLRGDLWNLSVNFYGIYSKAQEAEKIESYINADYSNNCKLCYELKHGFLPSYGKFSGQVIDGAVSLMEFPYPAFGLLIDNSISLGANNIGISIQGEQLKHYIVIQDNAKTVLSEEDMISCLLGFESSLNLIMTGFDKKIKKQIIKENHKKEYGINLKLGCLGLGKKFLLVSANGDNFSVFLCFKDDLQAHQIYQESKNKNQAANMTYAFHYYAFNATTKQLVNPQMQSSRQYVQNHYKKYIKLATASKSIKNTIYIFQTFLDNPNHLVTFNYESNDLLYGDRKKIDKLASYGFNMDDSVDVSLRAYLSLLYLKSEHIKITLGIKHAMTMVVPQGYLEKIDKACRTGQVIDLEDIVEFEFKMLEVYWQRQIRRNNHFFSNGILLYSKNRLISRYRIDLGGLLPLMSKQVTALTNYLPFFGYAELPENIPVNVFKTNFSFNILMQKLFCRLKFVEQGFKRRESMLIRAGKISLKNTDRRQKIGQQAWGSRKKKKPQLTLKERISQNKQKQEDNKVPDVSNEAFLIKKHNQQVQLYEEERSQKTIKEHMVQKVQQIREQQKEQLKK